MRSDLKELLGLLSETEYITAVKLSECLGVSPKTVRNRLKELNEIGQKYGAVIDAKSWHGFILCQEKEGGIERLKLELEQGGGLPDSNEDRTNYLLAYLLNHSDYVKIEELSDFLCVSRSTLQSSVREVEEILSQYHIRISRKPNYGIRVEGSEFDIRRCIGECFVRRNMMESGVQLYSEAEMAFLADEILRLTGKYKVSLTEGAFELLITQIYVALKRIKHGCCVEIPETADMKKHVTERRLAEELAGILEKWQNAAYDEKEIRYTVIYLAGIRILGGTENDAGNFVIREELDQLVLDMLEAIYEEYRIELRNNFNLRMALNQHMVPLDIRIRYHIKISNPIMTEIRENYAFAYTLAEKCAMELVRYYQQEIPEDETGYLAVILALGLEQRSKNVRRSKILIVCGAGRGSSRMLRYKYEQEFGAYLEKISVCGLHELPVFDLEQVDYVFTTVPIHRKIPVPIIEVGQFLGNADIARVKGILERGHIDFLDEYYREEQFLVETEGSTREEVIRNLCSVIEKQRCLPEGFMEAVMERERLAQTDFGNHIAMPHPYKVMTEETFVYVAVLKKEILWSKHPVQLVFLTAVCEKEDRNLPRFYDVTTKLFMQEDMVRQIIEKRSYSVLMQILRQIYYDL